MYIYTLLVPQNEPADASVGSALMGMVRSIGNAISPGKGLSQTPIKANTPQVCANMSIVYTIYNK